MKCFPVFIIAAVAFLCSHFSYSQNDSTNHSDTRRLLNGVAHNLSSPIRWQLNDWGKAGVIVLSTALVSTFDRPVRKFSYEIHNEPLDLINEVGYWYGKPQSAIAFSGGFYLTGLATKNEWARETGLMLGTALMTSAIIEAALKTLVGRARPSAELGNYSFHPFEKDAKFHSFPSGHSTIAYTISFVLANRVNSKPLKILFYTLAASTAFCRIYSDAHWVSDVVMGGSVAWFCSSESVRFISQSKSIFRHSKHKIALTPGLTNMSLTIKFNER